MTVLPVVHGTEGTLVADPDTGEALALHTAPDRALLDAAVRVRELEAELKRARVALAAELKDRHGVGSTDTAGYRFVISESRTWPAGAAQEALDALVDRGSITAADAARCMPAKPTPDRTQLKALAGRLAVDDPDGARTLAWACTVSPPSVRDVRATAVEAA
jgi:hypothetical protein